jgi:hypothetical protein
VVVVKHKITGLKQKFELMIRIAKAAGQVRVRVIPFRHVSERQRERGRREIAVSNAISLKYGGNMDAFKGRLTPVKRDWNRR